MRKSLFLFTILIYGTISYSQNVGIGTTTPATKLTVFSNLYGIEHTNGTVSLATYLSAGRGWVGTKSNHPLSFFTNNGLEQMTLTQEGQVGIGTTAPTAGYLLDVAGAVRNSGAAAHFVANATGGDNSWARFYMRSLNPNQSILQSWFIGTSKNFGENQFYLADETNNHTRLSIQPNNGPIYMQGNITQDLGGYGLPKAMLYVNGDGTITRCYNAITGSTSAGCGFSVSKNGSGRFNLTFNFDIHVRFFSITVEDTPGAIPIGLSYGFLGPVLRVFVYENHEGGVGYETVDRPFMIIVY